MDGIFISYRRDDSAGYAGRLYDRLAAHFGAGRVFMDVEGIEPGTDFVVAIERAVASCQVLIVLIGDEWLSLTDTTGRRRLDDPHDFIRLETSTALQRDIRVVPVLLDGTPMPPMDQLPDDLQSLVRRQAVELTHKQWEATSGELIRTLEKILAAGDAESAASAAEETAALAPPAPPATPSAATAPTPAGSRKPLWLGLVALLVAAAGLILWQSMAPAPPPAATVAAPTDAPVPAAVTEAPQPTPPAPQKTPARLVAESTQVDFGQVSTGGQRTREYRIRNSGETGAAVSARLMGEAAGNFRIIVDTCSANLRPGGSCSYSIVYQPVAAGKHEAGLVLSAPDSALEVVLSGRAEAPAPVVTAPPAPTPTPPAAPAPKILRLTAKSTADGAQVCYRVDNATELILEPRPGALRNASEDCVDVPLPRKVTLTLIARGAGGQAASRFSAGPLPAPAEVVRTPAPAATSARQPAAGDSWVYRSRGKWATSPKRTFVLRVDRVDNALVYESLAILEPERERGKSLRSQGTAPGFIDWGTIGWEFSPWLMAFEALNSSSQWRGIRTPQINNLGDWNTTARAVGVETVSVPAGRFKAIEVEVWARRQPTEGSTRAGQEPTAVKFNIWYAIESKRYVKMVRIITAANSQRLEEDTVELVEYKTR